MRILIATDAWRPQVNGVVSTLEHMTEAGRRLGARFEFLTPEAFWTAPAPTDPQIRLAVATSRGVERRVEEIAPDHIHIATEGPIGWLARRFCVKSRRIFTTSYHTRFPEYLRARLGVPVGLTYAGLRYFHARAATVMAPTPSIVAELAARRFERVRLWTRGVDHTLFRPRAQSVLDLPRPIFLSVGRLAVEKNLDAFLKLDLPGSKVIVGDGPARASLCRRYPGAHFLGALQGEALAAVYASADVFVFPSRTDTFGIVLLEAMASGLPVAAFPAPGPVDVVPPKAGALDDDLRAACLHALTVSREAARAHALRYRWEESARQFLENVEASRGARIFAPARKLKLLRGPQNG